MLSLLWKKYIEVFAKLKCQEQQTVCQNIHLDVVV